MSSTRSSVGLLRTEAYAQVYSSFGLMPDINPQLRRKHSSYNAGVTGKRHRRNWISLYLRLQIGRRLGHCWFHSRLSRDEARGYGQRYSHKVTAKVSNIEQTRLEVALTMTVSATRQSQWKFRSGVVQHLLKIEPRLVNTYEHLWQLRQALLDMRFTP